VPLKILRHVLCNKLYFGFYKNVQKNCLLADFKMSSETINDLNRIVTGFIKVFYPILGKTFAKQISRCERQNSHC
jgi:hypothetical protein